MIFNARPGDPLLPGAVLVAVQPLDLRNHAVKTERVPGSTHVTHDTRGTPTAAGGRSGEWSNVRWRREAGEQRKQRNSRAHARRGEHELDERERKKNGEKGEKRERE